MPLNLPTDCDGCGKKFLVPHDLSCPKGGLVLAWHNDTSEEWGALSDQAMNPLCISYKPEIKIRTVKAERNRAGARVHTGIQEGEVKEEGECAIGQETVPDESQVDVGVHGFWKWGTSALFDIQIFNLDAGF